MYKALLIVYLLIAIGLIILIMLQQGKGADIGASSFSVGNSGTIFGSGGSSNFMTRVTAVLAALFFLFSLVLGKLSKNHDQEGSQWDNLNQASQQVDKTLTEALVKPGNDIPQ